jgi:hypothetical protein
MAAPFPSSISVARALWRLTAVRAADAGLDPARDPPVVTGNTPGRSSVILSDSPAATATSRSQRLLQQASWGPSRHPSGIIG